MKIAIGGVRGLPAHYRGYETAVDETARRMQQLGHNVTVYCRAKKGEGGESEYAGIKLVHLRVVPFNNLETIFHSIAVGLHVAFHRKDIDVVHMYNAASAFGGIFVRLAGKPLVMTLDGVDWERDAWGWIARLVLKMSYWLAVRVANVVVCDSKVVKTIFDKRFGANTHVIHYGAKRIKNANNSYQFFGLERFKYFIFIGQLVREKGADILLDAYAKVGSDMPLVIVGDNELDPEYVAMLHRKAGANVRFLGCRYGEEYESLLSNARAYVTASKLEGTSPSLLAAMGAHVCCLVRGIPENIETGGDAVLYFNGGIEDLVSKWRMISEDANNVNQFASKGFERVVSEYDWDAVTMQYLTVYSDTLGDIFSKSQVKERVS
jgi:glycosyltransferase involved in cell wall biosynthesis